MCERCRMFVAQCGMHVHHTTYERLDAELMDDLELLCSGCHAVHHGHEPPEWYTRRIESMTPWTKEQAAELAAKYMVERKFKHLDDAVDAALAEVACFVGAEEIIDEIKSPVASAEVVRRWMKERRFNA